MVAANVQDTPAVTVSLTAISSRFDALPRTIDSLLAQDYPNLSVRLYLSREPFLIDKGVGEAVPAALKDIEQASDGRFSIGLVPNIGSYRKLLPFLLENWGQQRLVATADDDTIYPPDWMSTLMAHYQRWRCVIAFRGHYIRHSDGALMQYRSWMRSKVRQNPGIFCLPTGKDGILYDTQFFHPSVIDYRSALEIAPTADDLWFKWHTAANDVPVFLVNSDYRTQTFSHGGFQESLFDTFNRGGKNDEAIGKLVEYGRRRLDLDLIGRWGDFCPDSARAVTG
ncbi:MAG: glycosyltransferase family A protein [Pseudomonadota bacterium]